MYLGHPMRGDCCTPELSAYCSSPLQQQQQLHHQQQQQQQQQRSSSLCRQPQQQQQYHHHQPMDCNSLNRIPKSRGPSCRSCTDSPYMGENSVPTSLGVVVIPIAAKPSYHHQQQVSIVSKQNNCSVASSSSGFASSRDFCQTESDYLDMASVR